MSKTKTYPPSLTSLRKQNEITLHRLITEGKEEETLAYIEELLSRSSRFKIFIPTRCSGLIIRHKGSNGWRDYIPPRFYQSTAPHKALKFFIPQIHLRYNMLSNEVPGSYQVPYENINEINKDGKTALHLAASAGMFRVVKRLVEAGSPINARDGAGRTALMRVITSCNDYGSARNIINFLIDNGADLNIRDTSLSVAHNYALVNKKLHSKKLLAKLTPSINIKIEDSYPLELRKIYQYLQQRLNEHFVHTNKYALKIKDTQEIKERKYTKEKKESDRQIIETICGLIRRLNEIPSEYFSASEYLEITINILRHIGILCSMLSKETKGGYQNILWTEVEYLQYIFEEKYKYRTLVDKAFAQMITEILSDLNVIRTDLNEMLSEYTQWEERNEKASSSKEVIIGESLKSFHVFIRFFHDQESIQTILDLIKVSCDLNLESAEGRRNLFTILRKIGDTSKFELLGTNLSRTIKFMLPEFPWESLHKVRNLLKEANQKYPERRKFLNKLIRGEKAKKFEVSLLREDLIKFSIELENIKNRLARKFYQGIDNILSIYSNEFGEHDSKELRTIIFLSKENKLLLKQIIEPKINQKIAQNKKTQRLRDDEKKFRQEVENLRKNSKLSPEKKEVLIRKKEAKIKEIEKELENKNPHLIHVIKALQGNLSLSSQEMSEVIKLLQDSDDEALFLEIYLNAYRFKSFGLFCNILNIPEKSEPTSERDAVTKAYYLELAKEEFSSLFNILFPDEKMQKRVLDGIAGNPDYLFEVNGDARIAARALDKFSNNLFERVRISTALINLAIYLSNSGLSSWYLQARVIMEHFNAMYMSFQEAIDYSIWNDVLALISNFYNDVADFENKLKEEITAAGEVYPVIDDERYLNILYPFINTDAVQWFKSETHLQNTQQVKNEKINIIETAPDGDCMFNAIREGLNRVNNSVLPEWSRNANTNTLRTRIAEELNSNIDTYYSSISSQILASIRNGEVEGFPEEMANRMYGLYLRSQTVNGTELAQVEREIIQFAEDSILDYINALGLPCELWGGNIELGVLSRELGIQFMIVYRSGDLVFINNTGNQNAPRIDLDFDGSHYNYINTDNLEPIVYQEENHTSVSESNTTEPSSRISEEIVEDTIINLVGTQHSTAFDIV